jgi:hypothetical protein
LIGVPLVEDGSWGFTVMRLIVTKSDTLVMV